MCRWIFAFSIIVVSFFGYAQIRTNEEPVRLYYQRTHRIRKFNEMQNMRDVLHLNKYWMGKRRLSGTISYQFGRLMVDRLGIRYPEFRSSMAYFLRYRFFEEFSLNVIFFRELNPQTRVPWLGDYSFSIGRYNWRKNKVNVGYENYSNLKLGDNFSSFLEKLLQGYLYTSYNFNFKNLNNFVHIDNTSACRFTTFLRYSVNYRNEAEKVLGDIFNGKPTAGVSLRYIIWKNIYAEYAVYCYLPGKKEPWDPDFSYGFGYFDWRPFHVSFTYGNWSINRFPWNNSIYKDYGFLDGNFRFTFNWAW
jgi:hypothetical protein